MSNDVIYVSCAELIKRTATQLKFLRDKPKVVSPGMVDGDNYAKRISGKYQEMRNQYRFTEKGITYVMFFSFDEIILGEDYVFFIEHKFIKDKNLVEDWFLSMSILQIATYYSLHRIASNHRYVTATFAVKNGAKKNALSVFGPQECEMAILNFGGDKYLINVLAPNLLVEFFKLKLIASMNYETAKSWDLNFKHKEQEILKVYYKSNSYEQQEIY